MKTRNLLTVVLIILIMLVSLSCHKEDTDSPGEWVFWTSSPLNNGITVTVENLTPGYITGVYSTTPDCNTLDCYTVDLLDLGVYEDDLPKTFHYTAVDTFGGVGHSWNGTIVVTDDNFQHCNSTKLYY